MNLKTFVALFFPVILSGLSVYLFKTNKKLLKLLLAFSGAFLLSLSLNELLPEIYESGETKFVGLFILIGFIIQLILDYITKGVEHGHDHQHHHEPVEGKIKISFLPVMIGICIHSFLEGMPLSENSSVHGLQNQLLVGIVIHNIPISLVLVSLFFNAGVNRMNSFVLLLIFALSAPLGTFVSHFLGSTIHFNNNYILAIVVGIFMHISTVILFETEENHGFNLYKFLVIIVGAAIPFAHIH